MCKVNEQSQKTSNYLPFNEFIWLPRRGISNIFQYYILTRTYRPKQIGQNKSINNNELNSISNFSNFLSYRIVFDQDNKLVNWTLINRSILMNAHFSNITIVTWVCLGHNTHLPHVSTFMIVLYNNNISNIDISLFRLPLVSYLQLIQTFSSPS